MQIQENVAPNIGYYMHLHDKVLVPEYMCRKSGTQWEKSLKKNLKKNLYLKNMLAGNFKRETAKTWWWNYALEADETMSSVPKIESTDVHV